MTQVINMFGGPGAGKSTTSAGLFHKMKKLNLKVELVTGYAKEKVYENSKEIMADQLYLLAKQNRRLERLLGKVDYIITDSPLLLCAYYVEKYGNHPDLVVPLAKGLFNKYNNFNIFIERTKPYAQYGKLGSEDKAIEADKGIIAIISSHNYISIKDDDRIILNILSRLVL